MNGDKQRFWAKAPKIVIQEQNPRSSLFIAGSFPVENGRTQKV
jgi:hypothetical protein